MNPVQNLIAFIATLSIILYFLVIARYLKKIMLAVEKLAGMKLEKIVICENCGREINLGVSFRDQYTNCPKCNHRVLVNKQEAHKEVSKKMAEKN